MGIRMAVQCPWAKDCSSFSHGYMQKVICPARPQAAEFQEHLVYSSWIMHVVASQTERLVKTHAVQEDTSGMGWNHWPVLSSKALPHQIYESSCLVLCMGMDLLSVKTILYTKDTKKTWLGKFLYVKVFHIQNFLNVKVFHIQFLFFGQNKHRHIIMYLLFSINLKKIFTFSQVDL